MGDRFPAQLAELIAAERERPGVAERREELQREQPLLNPDRLVFIDETWTATNMTRSHGRCPKGERLRMGFPHGHRKTTTLLAGLRMTGMVAPMVLDGPINGDWFEAYVTQVLVPELRPGDVVIMVSGVFSSRGSMPLGSIGGPITTRIVPGFFMMPENWLS
jgi:hypothetical protein